MASLLKEFCEGQRIDDWQLLPISSQEFLQNLSLPSVHPYCKGGGFVFPQAPPMGPPTSTSEEDPFSMIEMLVTFWYFYVFPVMALVDLWVRILSCWIAPLGFGYLSWQNLRHRTQHPFTFCITIGSSWILMADDQYVIQFGRSVGFLLILGTLLVSHTRLQFSRSIYMFAILALLYPTRMDDPEELPLIKEGLYFNHDNPAIRNITQVFEQSLPLYSDIATPWQLSGDIRTGFPYLMNSVDQPPEFHRVWMPTEDDEFMALDIAFPSVGHNEKLPIYLIFHGLNGGSEEGYVIDLAYSRIKQGSTVVVAVARGLMDTPLQGWTFYHGARIIDAHSAASTLKERVVQPNQTLAGVGYSLGGIVLNNYVASYGDEVALDVSVSISGGLECTKQKDYRRSQYTWQPLIAAFSKMYFMERKWGQRLYHMLGKDGYQGLMRATSVVDVDGYASVEYNGYKDHIHFYTEMSAIERHDPSRKHFAIPHLVLQAFDDPISTWRNNADSDPSSPLYPPRLTSIQENLVVLLTQTGGHVGWPVGLYPKSWIYMNDYVAVGFIDAFEISQGRSVSRGNSHNQGYSLDEGEFNESTDLPESSSHDAVWNLAICESVFSPRAERN